MMRILPTAGHGAGDPGASGCEYKEANLTKELVNLIAPKLRKYAIADICNQNRSALYDVQNGIFKISGCDYVPEIHFNAFGGSGHGTEIFVAGSEKHTDVEQVAMSKLRKYFMKCGGSGVGATNWLMTYTCKCLGISSALLETCSIGGKTNMAEYQINKESIAQGIIDGIAEGFQLKANNTEQKPGNKPAKYKKLSKPVKLGQSDQILCKGEYFVITRVHSVDQVLANTDSIWCEETIGNGGNPIQAGPLTKYNKNDKKTKS